MIFDRIEEVGGVTTRGMPEGGMAASSLLEAVLFTYITGGHGVIDPGGTQHQESIGLEVV